VLTSECAAHNHLGILGCTEAALLLRPAVGDERILRQFDSFACGKVYDVSAMFSHRVGMLSLRPLPSCGTVVKEIVIPVDKGTYSS
jgi:hypothetical protein